MTQMADGRVFSSLFIVDVPNRGELTLGPSINISRNLDLSPIITYIERIIAKYEENYEADFLGPTTMRIKEIGELYQPPAQPVDIKARVAAQNTTKETPGPALGPTGPTPEGPTFVRKEAYEPFVPQPPKIMAEWGIHTQDPTVRIERAINKLERTIKQTASPVRGWEALADTLAMVVGRALNPQPVTGPVPSVSPTPKTAFDSKV